MVFQCIQQTFGIWDPQEFKDIDFENVKIPSEIKPPLTILPVEAELYVFSFGDGGDGVSDGDVKHE